MIRAYQDNIAKLSTRLCLEESLAPLELSEKPSEDSYSKFKKDKYKKNENSKYSTSNKSAREREEPPSKKRKHDNAQIESKSDPCNTCGHWSNHNGKKCIFLLAKRDGGLSTKHININDASVQSWTNSPGQKAAAKILKNPNNPSDKTGLKFLSLRKAWDVDAKKEVSTSFTDEDKQKYREYNKAHSVNLLTQNGPASKRSKQTGKAGKSPS